MSQHNANCMKDCCDQMNQQCCCYAKSPLVPGTKPNRPLTYLASPYTHSIREVVESRVKQATRATVWLIQEKGFNVFSPIVHSHPLAEAGLQGDWDFWKKIDTEYISVSERMVILAIEGWRTSKGVQAEIKIAENMGIPVYYLRSDAIDWSTFIMQSVPFAYNPWDPAPPALEPPILPEGFECRTSPPCDMQQAKEQEPAWLGKTLKDAKACFAERNPGVVRKFSTGATRDSEEGKFDYEGFLSPLVLEEFGKYMHKHRKQSDGNLRDSDNWQKGIPKTAYIKSLWRHLVQLWKLHRGLETRDERGALVTIPEACSAILFNVQGYLFEYLMKR